jgi:hypothetical protein
MCAADIEMRDLEVERLDDMLSSVRQRLSDKGPFGHSAAHDHWAWLQLGGEPKQDLS